MQLVNFHYFYGLSKALQELNYLAPEQPILSNWAALYNAEVALRAFLTNQLLPPEASRESGDALVALIDKLTSDAIRLEPISSLEVTQIKAALSVFENVLEGEYRIKTIFSLSKKGLYSLNELVYRGEHLVPESLHEVMPEIVRDLRDACRCIAFEVPTAAAFHLFRSTESAVKAYIAEVRGKPVTEREKNLGLGGYRKILDQLSVDGRILGALDQLIRLHRNPTIHPEVHVTNEEVLATLGMVGSLIRIIGIDMLRRKNDPETSLDASLPTDSEISAPVETIKESLGSGEELPESSSQVVDFRAGLVKRKTTNTT